jgi:hypothetical protein
MAVDPKTLKVGDRFRNGSSWYEVVRISEQEAIIHFQDNKYQGIYNDDWWWADCGSLITNEKIPGLATDTPTTTNDAGGKQDNDDKQEIDRLRRLIVAMAERIFGQSELLSKRAEKCK